MSDAEKYLSQAFVSKVKERMKQKGWTQVSLARACSITQPYLSQILSGTKQAKVPVLEKMMQALGIEVSFSTIENEKQNTHKEKQSDDT